MRQAEVRENKPCGLVDRVLGAVSIAEVRRREAIGQAANQLLYGNRVVQRLRQGISESLVGESITFAV